MLRLIGEARKPGEWLENFMSGDERRLAVGCLGIGNFTRLVGWGAAPLDFQFAVSDYKNGIYQAGPTALRKIGAAMNLARVSIYRRLTELVAAGQVTATGNTRNVKYAAFPCNM